MMITVWVKIHKVWIIRIRNYAQSAYFGSELKSCSKTVNSLVKFSWQIKQHSKANLQKQQTKSAPFYTAYNMWKSMKKKFLIPTAWSSVTQQVLCILSSNSVAVYEILVWHE